MKEEHVAAVEAWRQDRIERLRRPDSWLSLAGLGWLEVGESTCGSDPSSDVELPASAPARTGTFHVDASGTVEFEAAPDAGVKNLGREVGRMKVDDDSGGTPTLLEVGTVTFFVIRRGERLGVRIKDSASAVRSEFEGIESYPISWQWRLEARFERYDPPRAIPIPNVLGTIEDEQSPGAVVFKIDGKSHRIDALPGADDDEVFLVFGDLTNGQETYGGGRFLYADLSSDGKMVVDFNRSYNPPCAFTPYATCPLPPQQNRLDLLVRAGEKNYGDLHH